MSETFTIYHGSSSPIAIEKANNHAPEFRHGYCWTLQKQTAHNTPWILDNGVYSAHINNRRWSPERWAEVLMNCREKMPTKPDFVILPDALGDAELTYERSRRYADNVFEDWPRAFAVQDGMEPNRVIETARGLDCNYLFIGGSVEWKRKHAKDYIKATKHTEIDVHIARPSLPKGLMWAKDIGARSVDTSTIAQSESYHHLEKLQTQTGLSDYARN